MAELSTLSIIVLAAGGAAFILILAVFIAWVVKYDRRTPKPNRPGLALGSPRPHVTSPPPMQIPPNRASVQSTESRQQEYYYIDQDGISRRRGGDISQNRDSNANQVAQVRVDSTRSASGVNISTFSMVGPAAIHQASNITTINATQQAPKTAAIDAPPSYTAGASVSSTDLPGAAGYTTATSIPTTENEPEELAAGYSAASSPPYLEREEEEEETAPFHSPPPLALASLTKHNEVGGDTITPSSPYDLAAPVVLQNAEQTVPDQPSRTADTRNDVVGETGTYFILEGGQNTEKVKNQQAGDYFELENDSSVDSRRVSAKVTLGNSDYQLASQ